MSICDYIFISYDSYPIIYLLFVEFKSVFLPCIAVFSTFNLNLGESPLLLLLTMFSSSCILGAIILAKTYNTPTTQYVYK